MKYIGIDMGGSNVRIFLANTDDAFSITEIYRFVTPHYCEKEHVFWNLKDIIKKLEEKIAKIIPEESISSIGIDTWGVDFVRIHTNQILANPIHYRDATHLQAHKQQFKLASYEYYNQTGIHFMSINTSNQIYSQFEKTQDFLEKTDAIRMIGEYVYSYFAGKDLQEKTIRSTSQFVDIKQSMDARSLIYTPMAPEEFGKKVKVNREKTETSFEKLWTDKPVIHDRACSLFNTTPGQLFIISGTWSLVGIRLENPILEKESYEAGFSNEFTPEWNIDFLKNVPGMWFFQQLLDDQEILSNHIYQKHPTFIDPWHTLFSSHINMFSQICEYAKITHKIPPTSISEAINIVIQSLAKSYTQIVQSIEQITNNTNESIKIMGGGAKCNALNQLIADYSGKKVIIETIESSVIGNIAYQIQEKEGKQKANDFYTSQIDGTIFFPNRKHTNNNDK